MTPAGTVRVLRGDRVESVHRFVWRLWEGDGGGARGGGELERVFLRSAAKPFQTLPAVRAGVLERFGLDGAHLAVSCGSHGGTAHHLARVDEILAACGVDDERLGCGAIEPRDPRARDTLRGRPRRVHHNCSGKHALGLALCRAEGWPLAGYLEPGHPLQSAMRESIAEAAGVAEASLDGAVDGCGMQTYAVPLERLAAAYGRLAGGGLGDAGARTARAMTEHPALVGFVGAVDTELMVAAPGVVAKIGAEAVIAVGTPDGRGLALKVVDGNPRALDPAAVLAARELLGIDLGGQAVDALAAPEVRNSRDELVGRLEASLDASG